MTAPTPPRSAIITAMAWVVIVVGALLSIISFITALMFIAGSYGTKNAGALDALTMIAGPPFCCIAGIGLLRRKRWAWFCMVALLFAALAWQVSEIVFPPPSAPWTYISETGVPTTMLGGGPGHSLPIIAACIGALAVLFLRQSRAEFAAAATPGMKVEPAARAMMSRGEYDAAEERAIARGWRAGHRGRDQMCYEEHRDGRWQWIEIDGEMLTGRAHHVICFASPETWQGYPAWARERRDEIIARIKGEFREPDYEYSDGGTIGATGTPPAVPHAASLTVTPGQFRALLVVLALLLGITGFMGWLVSSGLRKDETYWPSKSISHRRTVSRTNEPVMFWTSIGLYSGIGIGTLTLAACLIRWSRK